AGSGIRRIRQKVGVLGREIPQLLKARKGADGGAFVEGRVSERVVGSGDAPDRDAASAVDQVAVVAGVEAVVRGDPVSVLRVPVTVQEAAVVRVVPPGVPSYDPNESPFRPQAELAYILTGQRA